MSTGYDGIKIDIVERISPIAEYPTGWCKELNIVSWNEGAPKYDLRDWDPSHTRMTKGITLYEQEARNLLAVLANHFDEKDRVAD